MKLIAFDLEACNRYVKGSIFSIGVVESDSNFNILKKYEILINPETKFVTKFRKPINFNIDKDKLKSMPNFRESYDLINRLFSQDALYIAHAASNDVRMLISACKRYKVPSLRFQFICSQMLYTILTNQEDGIGLDKASELLHHDFIHHQAEQDALACLMLVKYVCEQNQTSLEGLIIDYGIKYGSLNGFNARLMRSKKLDAQRETRRNIRLQQKLKDVNKDY